MNKFTEKLNSRILELSGIKFENNLGDEALLNDEALSGVKVITNLERTGHPTDSYDSFWIKHIDGVGIINEE
jgi:hypothetical protein